MEIMKRLVREEEGQGTLEYALLIGLIAIGAIALMGPIGEKVTEWFQTISDEMGVK